MAGDMSEQRGGPGIGSIFITGLALFFIGLKLGKVIDWSWWWVLAPIWGAFALVAVSLLIGLAVLIQQAKAGGKR